MAAKFIKCTGGAYGEHPAWNAAGACLRGASPAGGDTYSQRHRGTLLARRHKTPLDCELKGLDHPTRSPTAIRMSPPISQPPKDTRLRILVRVRHLTQDWRLSKALS